MRIGTLQTPYEIWKGGKSSLKHFHTFGSKCHVLNDRVHLEKFEPKGDEAVFIGYSETSRAYRVYNVRTRTIFKSKNIKIDNTDDYSSYS